MVFPGTIYFTLFFWKKKVKGRSSRLQNVFSSPISRINFFKEPDDTKIFFVLGCLKSWSLSIPFHVFGNKKERAKKNNKPN